MKIISIANRKGGVGKSTIAFNLAHSYALNNKSVLMMDIDTQVNLTMLANVNVNTLEEFVSIKIQKINDNLDILPACKTFNILEHEINNLVDRNNFFKKQIIPKIEALGYDYLIIDTPPSLNILNINCFVVSTFIHIIINPDTFSLNGLVEMRQIIEQIKELNDKLEYTIILNNFIKNRKFSAQVLQLLNEQENFSKITIPNRNIFLVNNSIKKHVLHNKELKDIFCSIEAIV